MYFHVFSQISSSPPFPRILVCQCIFYVFCVCVDFILMGAEHPCFILRALRPLRLNIRFAVVRCGETMVESSSRSQARWCGGTPPHLKQGWLSGTTDDESAKDRRFPVTSQTRG